jgi:chromosome segregation ATPase
MSESDKYLKILEKIGEVREDVAILNNDMQHVKETLREAKGKLEGIEKQDIQQNKLLDEHILGVTTATNRLELEIASRKEEHTLIRKQIQDLDNRLKKAEFLPTLMSGIKKSLKWLAGIVTATAIIAKHLKWF